MRQIKQIFVAFMLVLSTFSFEKAYCKAPSPVAECTMPTNLSCKPMGSSVFLSWTAVPGVTSYNVNLYVNDPACCSNGLPGYNTVLTTATNSITVSLLTYPCFSWQVASVCRDGSQSEYSKPQCACQHIDPPAAPCSTFNDPVNPAGNWVTNNVTADYTLINSIDGTPCVTLTDLSGATSYTNSVDYNNLGQYFLHQCLCFDYAFGYAAPYGGIPYHPTIYLTDGINTIAFVANDALYPDNNATWYHFCAPIEHCQDGIFPGNSDGNWVDIAGVGLTCDEFNHVMDNATELWLTPDINANPSEQMSFDNICVMQCNGCNSDFLLQTTFSTMTSTADASVALVSTDLTATYVVDWGDGTTGPVSTPHHYSSAGSYDVCVTETQADGTTCKTCLNFCFGKGEHSQGRNSGTQKSSAKPITPQMLKEIGEEELNINKDVVISPNPANNNVSVQMSLKNNGTVSISIADMNGNKLMESTGNYNAGVQNIQIDTKQLTNGVYTIKINADGKESNRKLSIVK